MSAHLRRLLLAFAGMLALAGPAYGQASTYPGTYTTCPGTNPSNLKCFTPYVGNYASMQYVSYQQITSLSSAASLTVPAAATFAEVVCTGQIVNYRFDGDTTVPTTTVGMPLTPYNPLPIPSAALMSSLRLIETTASATCNVSYFK